MFHVVIPARYGASRLPGKPLRELGGKTLIEWVWRRAAASGAESVIVATDDERIAAAARAFGADCVMTSATHASGTDRIAEVARRRGFEPTDVVVNLQGDEPLMPSAVIDAVAGALAASPADIATAATPILSLEEFLDPSCVKVVQAANGAALYFSRAPIPWPREHAAGGRPAEFSGAWRHVGIYAYRAECLARFALLPPATLELAEKLEQLRALEHGMRIQLVMLPEAPPPGVDTPEDLERVRRVIETEPRPRATA